MVHHRRAFEARALKAYLSVNPNLAIVDLREGIDLISSSGCAHHHHHDGGIASQDLHFWLSLKVMEKQVALIAEALGASFPELKERIEGRRDALLLRLKEVDQEISRELNPYRGKAILVSHPAYSYFCRDYHLEQIPIEWEGKDPTPRQLTRLIERAREMKIRVVFTQPQYSQKGADLIADLLHAESVSLDPYREDFIENLIQITHSFQRSF